MSAQLGWERPPQRSVSKFNFLSHVPSITPFSQAHSQPTWDSTSPQPVLFSCLHQGPGASGRHSEQPQETALNLSQEPHQARRKSLKCVPLRSSRVRGKGQNTSKELKTVYQTRGSSKKMLNFSPKCWVRAGHLSSGDGKGWEERARGAPCTLHLLISIHLDDSTGTITLNWK